MNNLDTIGLKGLILALGGVSGSVILAWVVYRFFFMMERRVFCFLSISKSLF